MTDPISVPTTHSKRPIFTFAKDHWSSHWKKSIHSIPFKSSKMIQIQINPIQSYFKSVIPSIGMESRKTQKSQRLYFVRLFVCCYHIYTTCSFHNFRFRFHSSFHALLLNEWCSQDWKLQLQCKHMWLGIGCSCGGLTPLLPLLSFFFSYQLIFLPWLECAAHFAVIYK